MSQHLEFVAADRMLDAAAIRTLRMLSASAEITPRSFAYHQAPDAFGGDPAALLERYFDVAVHVAADGGRTLSLRLPPGGLDVVAAWRYCAGDGAAVRATRAAAVVEFRSRAAVACAVARGAADRLLGLRAALLDGDLRCLYLGWLGCVQGHEVAGATPEPPRPDGLAAPTPALAALVEFLGIDPDLVAVAADGDAGRRTAADLLAAAAARTAWLAALAAGEAEAWARVDALIDGGRSADYARAVALLLDLGPACRRAGRAEAFDRRLDALRRHNARRPGLVSRLADAGLGPATDSAVSSPPRPAC